MITTVTIKLSVLFQFYKYIAQFSMKKYITNIFESAINFRFSHFFLLYLIIKPKVKYPVH